LCVGGESISTGGCEALPREAFTIEGHEANPAEARHQPAEVDSCAETRSTQSLTCATVTSWRFTCELRHAPYLVLFKQLLIYIIFTGAVCYDV